MMPRSTSSGEMPSSSLPNRRGAGVVAGSCSSHSGAFHSGCRRLRERECIASDPTRATTSTSPRKIAVAASATNFCGMDPPVAVTRSSEGEIPSRSATRSEGLAVLQVKLTTEASRSILARTVLPRGDAWPGATPSISHAAAWSAWTIRSSGSTRSSAPSGLAGWFRIWPTPIMTGIRRSRSTTPKCIAEVFMGGS